MASMLISKVSHLNFFAALTTNKVTFKQLRTLYFVVVLFAKFQWIFIHKLKNQQHTKKLSVMLIRLRYIFAIHIYLQRLVVSPRN